MPVNPVIATNNSSPRFEPLVYNAETKSQEFVHGSHDDLLHPSLDDDITSSETFSHTQPIPDMSRISHAGFSRTHPLLGDAIAHANMQSRKTPLDEFRDDESELQQ